MFAVWACLYGVAAWCDVQQTLSLIGIAVYIKRAAYRVKRKQGVRRVGLPSLSAFFLRHAGDLRHRDRCLSHALAGIIRCDS